MLTKQYEITRLNAENDVSTIQVIQKANIPERKSKPSRLKMVVMNMFIALFFSTMFVLFRENIRKFIQH
jgi:tyrosine-protein kinase Etk/Wzc